MQTASSSTLAANYGVLQLALFGSSARDEARLARGRDRQPQPATSCAPSRASPDDSAATAAGQTGGVLLGDGAAANVEETAAPSARAWMADRGLHAVLVRPDHYVFGGVGGASEVADLLDDLERALR
jgi:hypothetical protein